MTFLPGAESVAGKYPLLQLLEAGEQESVYATEVDETPAILRLRPAANGEEVENHWKMISELDHPNLLKLFAFGRADLAEKSVLYAVFEKPEETLEDVLRSRALTPMETREMLPPAMSALRYLHARGYVHGALQPSAVMAIGDTLKLSTGSIRPMPPTGSGEDIRALGVLISEVLTREAPEWRGDAVVLPPSVPPPFAAIVEHCCDPNPESRWTLDEAAEALEGKPVRAPAAPPPVIDAPAPPPRNPRTLITRSYPEPPPARERPRWLIPGIAVIGLLLVAILWASLRSTPSSHPAAAPRAAVPAPAAVTPGPVPTVVPGPVRAAPAAHTRRHHTGANSWYVVVATYAQKDQAEKRAREISRRFPHFRARVFAPPVEKPHHLVVIGEDLTEDGAESLRKRARAAGLPRDLYIKRFPG